MFRRIVSGIMIALLLTGTLFLVFNIHEFLQPFIAFAHVGDELSAWAEITPLIDGKLQPTDPNNIIPAEWEDADKVDFLLSWDGEDHEASLYVKNDWVNLYLAFVIKDEDFQPNDRVYFNFDNDHDGWKERGNDQLWIETAISDTWNQGGRFADGFFPTAADEESHVPDSTDNGYKDGVGAAQFTGSYSGTGSYVFEVAHPLFTIDSDHDFSLLSGQTVGFNVIYYDAGAGGSSDGWPTLTWWNWSQMADIIIANAPPPFCQVVDVNLEIRKIEVTQAVQWLDDIGHDDNSVPLAVGKSTVVRVYVDIGRPAGDPAWAYVYLYATDSSGCSLVQPLEGLGSNGPLYTGFVAPVTPDRGNENHTANFLLPDYWVDQGDLNLVAFVNAPAWLQIETSYRDNWMWWKTLSFKLTKSVEVWYYLIDYRPTAPDENPDVPDLSTVSTKHWFSEVIYPIPDLLSPINYIYKGTFPWNGPDFLNETGGFDDEAVTDLWEALHAHYEDCRRAFGKPDLLGAWYDHADLKVRGAWGRDNVFLSSYAAAPTTLAHEIGHGLGRRHTWQDPDWPPDYMANKTQTYGFTPCAIETYHWPPFSALDPLCGDIMSYDPPHWISPYTWEKIMEALDPPEGLSVSLAGETEGSSPGLLISGKIYENNTGMLNPIFQTPSFVNLTLPSGPYVVQLRGPPPAEPLLYSQNFNVSFSFPPDPQHIIGLEKAFFSLNLPFTTGAYSVSLWNTTVSPSILLDKITASPNPPSVTLTYPNGGETVGDPFNATWTASDPDTGGDPLTFKLFYSNDNGVTWNPLSPPVEGTSYRVDTSVLPGGSQCLIRVLASDGFYTSEDQSDDVFTVPLKGPRDLVITCSHNPYYNESVGGNESDHRVPFGDFIVLKGSAFDPEDGVLNGTALTWTSDINGTLGTGRVLTAMDLIPGVHNITLTATDSHGNNATKSFTITVVLNDIAMTDVTTSKIVTGQGYTLDINATVENQGNFPATFNVIAYANATEIETQEIALASGNTTTIVFTWNTTGFAKGNYTIWTYVWSLPGEIDMSDNFYGAVWVFIAKVGDFGGGLPPQFFQCDDKVDGLDLALFIQCYKKLAPPEAMYLADLGGGIPPQFFKCDEKVDGIDLALWIQCYKGLGPDA